MIKLIITQNEYDDKDDMIRTLHAHEAYNAISVIAGIFRECVKHGQLDNKELSAEEVAFAETLRDKVWDIISDLPAKY